MKLLSTIKKVAEFITSPRKTIVNTVKNKVMTAIGSRVIKRQLAKADKEMKSQAVDTKKREKSILKAQKRAELRYQAGIRAEERKTEKEYEKLLRMQKKSDEQYVEKLLSEYKPVRIDKFYKPNQNMTSKPYKGKYGEYFEISRFDETGKPMGETEALLKFIGESAIKHKEAIQSGKVSGTGNFLSNMLTVMRSFEGFSADDPYDINTLSVDINELRNTGKQFDNARTEIKRLREILEKKEEELGPDFVDYMDTAEFNDINDQIIKLEDYVKMDNKILKQFAGYKHFSDEATKSLDLETNIQRLQTFMTDKENGVTIMEFQDLLNAAGPRVEEMLTDSHLYYHFFDYTGYDSNQAKNEMTEFSEKLLRTKLPESAIDKFLFLVSSSNYEQYGMEIDEWLDIFEMFYQDVDDGEVDFETYDELWREI